MPRDKQLDELEKKLQQAVVQNDLKALEKMTHPNFTCTDELGMVHKSVAEFQDNHPNLIFSAIKTISKDINYFENVAVVNYTELRSGTMDGAPFESKFFVSRVWKKNSRWHLLSVTLVQL